MGQVLVYPGLGGDMTKGSYVDHANAPLLTTEECRFYQAVHFDGPPPTDDPTAAPLQDTGFSNLPPTVVFIAECDPIADDGRVYVERLSEAGVRAHAIVEPGLVHGYLRGRRTVTRIHDSFERIVLAIEALGQGLWPYDDD